MPPRRSRHDPASPLPQIHHTKHHATYVTNVNAALEKHPELATLTLLDLNEKVGTGALPADIEKVIRCVRGGVGWWGWSRRRGGADVERPTPPPLPSLLPPSNHGGGHLNHTLFWTYMAPPTSTNGPSDGLKAAIDAAFGSADALKTQFNAAAAGVFGSGWAWLVAGADGKLVITTTPNQDNPFQAHVDGPKGLPVLGLDVWEHAYYLKVEEKREWGWGRGGEGGRERRARRRRPFSLARSLPVLSTRTGAPSTCRTGGRSSTGTGPTRCTPRQWTGKRCRCEQRAGGGAGGCWGVVATAAASRRRQDWLGGVQWWRRRASGGGSKG